MNLRFLKCGVVAYSVIQVHGSLALEDYLEVGALVLGRCSISCVCTSAVYLSAKEGDPQFAIGPSGREFSDFPYLMGVAGLIPARIIFKRAWIGPEIGLFIVFQPRALEQS